MSEFEIVMCISIFLWLYFVRFLHKVWWKPIQLESKMKSQGVRGPSYKFIQGNNKEINSYMSSQITEKSMDISHDLFPRVHPHVYAWTKAYGRNFICWHGSQCQMYVTEPELSKEILMNKDGGFSKMKMTGYLKKLLGEALTTNEGEKWAKIRKLADRTFHSDSLKRMVPEMSSCVGMMLEKWEFCEGQEIDVSKEFRMLTSEVISRTTLGSSYVAGKHIFEMKARLTQLAVQNLHKIRVPGISFLIRSKDEIEASKLQKEIKNSVMRKVTQRERSKDIGNDYLGQLIKLSHESDPKKRITRQQLVDEITAIYGAANLTTTSLLSWCVLLLATHTQWQEKAREEVRGIFGNNTPDFDGISRLKTMSMIINECLRLYPPALTITRRVVKETKIGEICFPTNMNVYISVLAMHHDPQIWGDDVQLFRPERFKGGIGNATSNKVGAFMPFGMGSRICVGMNFTIDEVKIAVSLILQKYRLVVSPKYVHCPVERFVLVPKNGIQIIIQKI